MKFNIFQPFPVYTISEQQTQHKLVGQFHSSIGSTLVVTYNDNSTLLHNMPQYLQKNSLKIPLKLL